MVAVIIGSKRMGINPDNVATPMAASFGDLITLASLVCFSQWFYSLIGKERPAPRSQRSCNLHFWPTEGALQHSHKEQEPGLNEWLHKGSCLNRPVSARVVPGGSVVFVPDSSLGGHLLQTSSQSHPAPHRLGANYYSYGHQQVLIFDLESIHMSSNVYLGVGWIFKFLNEALTIKRPGPGVLNLLFKKTLYAGFFWLSFF